MTTNVPASIRARLLAAAKMNGEEFERTLSRFATERLIFRLGESKAQTRCILKGAALLTIWMSDPYRATRDVDFLASGDAGDDNVREIIEQICAVPCPEDGLSFDLSDLKLQAIRAEEEYVGKRARFVAYLGTARIRVQIDFGFGDAITTKPDVTEYPTILKDIPAPHILAYPRAISVAEKFEAMAKLDIRNSRMKDFHDIWALSSAFEFDGASLQNAVAACFKRRKTPWTDNVPSALTSAFYQDSDLQQRWTGYIRSGGVRISPPSRFEAIGERVVQFLGPVRDSIVSGKVFPAVWVPGGPWG
jgi:hypothetical protein